MKDRGALKYGPLIRHEQEIATGTRCPRTMVHIMMRAMSMLFLLAAAEAFSMLSIPGGAITGRFVRFRCGEHLRASMVARK